MSKSLGSKRHKALIDLLIAKREAAGMTQAELAEQLDEYQSFVARLESGQRRLDVVEFLDVAKALGLNPTKVISNLEKIT